MPLHPKTLSLYINRSMMPVLPSIQSIGVTHENLATNGFPLDLGRQIYHDT